MTLLDAINQAIGERTLYRAAKDWEMNYETLRKYAREGRIPDAKTALKIADDAGIERGEMLSLMAKAEDAKKAATLESVAASSEQHILVARGGIEPPTQGFSILCSTD